MRHTSSTSEASFPPTGISLEPTWLDEETGVLASLPEGITPLPAAVNAEERGLLMPLTGPNAGQVFRLDTEATTVGRGRDAQMRVDDVGISRLHAQIVKRGNDFVLEDLGSRNGTFLNGRLVESPTRLSGGDRIQVGPSVILRFTLVDETEEALARQLYEASTRDGLTRVYNRRYFAERLAAETAFAQRHASMLSLLYVDIDHFKQVNDLHGHGTGDRVLVAVAQQIDRLIRVEDVFARIGGEEFALVVRGIGHGNAARFAERIRRAVAGLSVPAGSGGSSISVTVSIGVASLAECGPRARGAAPEASLTELQDRLVALADRRLYEAKAGGRDRVFAGVD